MSEKITPFDVKNTVGLDIAPSTPTAQAARVGFFTAADTNPDAFAEAQRVARRVGVSPDVVMAQPQEAKKQAAMGEINFDTLAQTNPAVAGILAHTDKARIAHDDIGNLSDIENALTYLGASGRAGLHDFAAAGAKLVDTINPFTTSDEDLAVLYKNDPEGLKRQREQGATAILSRFARNQTAQTNAIMQGIPQQTKDAYGNLEYATTDPEKAAYLHPVKVISDAIRSLPTTSAVILTAALTRGASLRAYNTAIEAGLPEAAARKAGVEAATHLASRFGAASEGSIGYAQQYNSTQHTVEQIPFSELEKSADFNALVDAGYDPNAARIFLSARTAEQSGVGAGVIDAVTSGVGGHYLGKIIGEGGKLLPRIGKGFVYEGLTETVQSGGEQLSENLAIQQHANPDQSLSADVVESMLQGWFVGGLTGGTISGIAGRAATEEKKVLGADLTTQQVEKLNALAASNKVLQRDTQTFEAFVKDASQDGPTNQVYISANALMQSGVAEKIAELSPSVAEQLPLAQNTGGMISIPTDEYMAKIAPTEFSAPLVDHLKFDPEGYSRAEAIEFQQNGYEALANEMAQALNKHQVDEEFQRSKAALRQRFISELNAVGKHPSAVNHAYGTFLAEYFATNAADLGMSPEELHNQYAIRFARGEMQGRYEQVAPLPRDQQGAHFESADFADALHQISLPNGMGIQAERNSYDGGFTGRANIMNGDEKIGYIDFNYNHETGEVVINKSELNEAQRGKGIAKAAYSQINTALLANGLPPLSSDPNNLSSSALNLWKSFVRDGLAHERTDGRNGYSFFGFDPNNPKILMQGAKKEGQTTIEVDGVERPTTNSNGQLIHPTEEGIRNFWRWFGDSKVVDDEGRPLVVYHGTKADFSEFTKGDLGYHFGTSQQAELILARKQYVEGAESILPVYLRADNPVQLPDIGFDSPRLTVLELVNSGTISKDAGKEINEEMSISFIDTGRKESMQETLREELLNLGIDGVVYENTGEAHRDESGKLQNSYIVFSPTQIKSATGNTGAFDPSNPNILHQQERGAFDPSTLTIALLEHADLSTFLHETGHFFLEMQFDLAAKLRGEADIFGMDSLRPGEQRIVNDTQAILDWFGIPDINTWYSLDLEQKRPYHEQVARGFEKYLFEGKAPSIELQSLFKKFADWLKKVYKTITEFGDVKLTPEVRGVFDRMLASEEQIHLAEQARSMMPLLEALDKAPMSVDDFERYQRENAEATDEAVTELTRRTLGDMKWLRNAKSKALKELQKDSREKRREVRMTVRAEVMSMPIYRAWTLLTAKQGPDNKIIPRPKSSPEHVNPEVDNLFVAIAKLGGLNKQELIDEWGIDPAYKPQSGIFGKPVFRAKDGGLSRKAMAELLVDHGYLSGDRDGKHDLREFEEKLDDQLRGTDQFSVMHDYSDINESRAGDHVNLDSLTAVRFDLGELRVAGLPDDVIKALEDRRMTSKSNGIHQDFVRDMILDEDGNPAFSSGDELARALATAEKPHEVIESLTDVRMLEEYGDIATPEALAQAADLAVLNRFRIKFATTQANALAAATGQRRVLEAAAKQLADTTIGRTLVRYLNPNKYLSAQARAAKAAADHLKKNDVTNAAAESRNQVFNMLAARAAMEARDEIKKIDQFFKKVVSGKDDDVVKSRDLDIVNAARAALRRFGYGHKAKTADAYLENVGKYDPELHQVLMGVVGQVDALANSIGSTNQTLTIKDLTVDQLRSLREDIDLLWNQAKRNHEIEVDGKMVNRQFAIDALQEQLLSLGLPESTVGQFHGVTDKEKVAMGIASTIALGKRVEFYVDWLDGGHQMGAFRTFIWNMIKDPATAYRAENARLLRAFRKLFDDVKDTFKPGLITAPELGGYTFGEVGGGVALNEILHAIAHTGNNSNKRKLLLGRGWATQRPDGSLDTTQWDAFVSRLIREGVLTKAHFDFVQGIWDLLESTKPAAQKAHREAYGKYFDEVTANAFMTPFGEYRGGYIPATVDSDQVKDMELKKLIEAGNDGMAYAFPTTNFGSRFSRVEYNRPLLLDLRTLPQHLNKVMLFSHMEMPGRDVRKLLASKEVGGLLNKVDPSAMNAMLMPWLTRSVKQQVSTPQAGLAPVNKFASMIRSRVVMASMFANVSNAVQQITGLFPAAHEVGAPRLAESMALYVKDPKAFTASIAELSPMMANRMDDEIGAMMDEVNAILLNPDLTKKAKDWSHRHIFFLQSAVDNIVSPIAWRSAFDKALAEDFNVKDAVRIADSIVRKTQGSSQAEDISRFESGPAYSRLLTVFSGFFLMQAGWLGSKLGVLMQQGGLRKNAGRAFMIYTLGFAAPAIVAEAISQAMRGGPDDDDKDGSYLDDWLQAVFVTGQIRGATAMVPIAGPAVNSAFARFNNNPMDDRLNISPVVTAIEGSVAVPYDLYKNMAGKGNAQRTIRDVGTLMTLFSGMPFSTAAKPIGYVAGVAQGKIEPTGPVDFTRGLISGVASPESKQR